MLKIVNACFVSFIVFLHAVRFKLEKVSMHGLQKIIIMVSN